MFLAFSLTLFAREAGAGPDDAAPAPAAPLPANVQYIAHLKEKYSDSITFSTPKAEAIVRGFCIDCKMKDGRYLPLANVLLSQIASLDGNLWKSFAADPVTLGKKGGRFMNYKNAHRRLSNSEFITLMAGGWVGTTVPQSAVLECVVRAVLATGTTVTFAVIELCAGALRGMVLRNEVFDHETFELTAGYTGSA